MCGHVLAWATFSRANLFFVQRLKFVVHLQLTSEETKKCFSHVSPIKIFGASDHSYTDSYKTIAVTLGRFTVVERLYHGETKNICVHVHYRAKFTAVNIHDNVKKN